MAIMINRKNEKHLNEEIEKLKKQSNDHSATQAIEKAIVYMVNEKPKQDKELRDTKQELKETKYLLDTLITKIKLKQDAEEIINQISNMV